MCINHAVKIFRYFLPLKFFRRVLHYFFIYFFIHFSFSIINELQMLSYEISEIFRTSVLKHLCTTALNWSSYLKSRPIALLHSNFNHLIIKSFHSRQRRGRNDYVYYYKKTHLLIKNKEKSSKATKQNSQNISLTYCLTC